MRQTILATVQDAHGNCIGRVEVAGGGVLQVVPEDVHGQPWQSVLASADRALREGAVELGLDNLIWVRTGGLGGKKRQELSDLIADLSGEKLRLVYMENGIRELRIAERRERMRAKGETVPFADVLEHLKSQG